MIHLLRIFTCTLVCFVLSSTLRADNIYIMNAGGYNTAQPDLIAALQTLGHTVTVNSTDFSDVPPAFTSACLDPDNGYHWLCFFGDFDFSYLAPQASNFISNGGKVYYNYEVSCCTTSSGGAAAMVAAITGLAITPSAVDFVGLSGGTAYGWQCEIPGCFTISGNAFKPFDGLPLQNQLIATSVPPGAFPDLSSGSNFGFFFTGSDIPNNTLNGSLTGMGDINMWYSGAEPSAAPIDLNLLAYFFPNETTVCHLATSGCATDCPFGNVLGADRSICANGTLTLDATSATAVSYLWNDNSTNATKTINQQGTYWVEVSDGTVTCRDSIVITTLVVVVDAGADVIICLGHDASLLATGADSYTWTPAATLNDASIPNPQASPITTTNYTVTGTTDGCSDTDVVTVVVEPIDATYSTETTVQVCDTQGSFVLSDVAGSSVNYTIELNGASISQDEVYTLNAGNYLLEITDENGCQAIENIVIAQIDDVITWSTTLSNVRCDTQGQIELTNVQGGTEPYIIKMNNNIQPDVVFEDLNGGNYAIQLEDQNGCVKTETYTISVLPNEISVNISASNAICETAGRLHNVAVTNAMLPIYMELDQIQYFNDDIEIDTSEHHLMVRDVDGCEVDRTFQVENVNPTEARFTADPYIANAPVLVTFTNSSLNANAYQWDFGNGEVSEDFNETMQYLEPGDYQVVLTAIDEINGCEDTSLYIIYVRPPNTIYVPNTFTPDNDGINDVFRVVGQNIATDNFTFSVYNRWGDAVWTSVDPEQVWTGSYKDGAYYLPDGVYPFIIKYRYLNSAEQLTLEGYIQIMR